ncbi:MAG: orotidine-5-phosphate decarboxylase [Chloroflexota bacterium]|jgi:orotidine-5'-phosphate decarboxylase|nr:orotidine-5-phosphate decarboxylase [Chloroflexota bacterium]
MDSTSGTLEAGPLLTFRERLIGACATRESHVCVGLDPDMRSLPAGFAPDPEDLLRFVTGIIEATAEFAAAYKPNSAFYEAMGPPGMEVLQAVIAAAPTEIPMILDVKRADVGNTAERYAHAAFNVYGAAAVTVNPYLGWDSIKPFADHADKGVFVLCRTSNPGAGDLQDLHVGGKPLYRAVARLAKEWDTNGNIGLVAGATWPEELAAVRAECPNMPLLIPGVGAQGGDVAAAIKAVAGEGGDQPFLLASSRAIMHAGSGPDYQHAAADAARDLRDRIRRAL